MQEMVQNNDVNETKEVAIADDGQEHLSSLAKDIIALGDSAAAIFADVNELKRPKPIIQKTFDPLIYSAGEQIVISQSATTSLLQKTIKISYVRAAKLMQELEMLGIIGEQKGEEPRKVLVSDIDEWKEICTNNSIKVPAPDAADDGKMDKQKIDNMEQEIELHSYPAIELDEATIGIGDNLIRLEKRVQLMIGTCPMNVLIPGKYIKGIILKKATPGNRGYFTFKFPDNLRFNKPEIDDPELDNLLKSFNMTTKQLVDTAKIDWNDSSDVCKVEFWLSQESNITNFLQQISKDTGVTITEL